MLAVEAAVSVLVPEPVDTGTADRADHVGGIVVVEHAIGLLAASFDIRNGEGMDARGFQNGKSDDFRCRLRGRSYAFLPDYSLALCWQVEHVAFGQRSAVVLEAQKSPTACFRPRDTRIVRSTFRDLRRRPF